MTIKDIAASLGMAHSTVSRALNDHPHINRETKARVRSAAQQLGYVANSGARVMRSGSGRVVGLIVPDLQNDFYSAAATVMARYCAADGYQLVLAVSEDDPEEEERQVQALREVRAAGVVIAATAHPRRQTLQLLGQLPVIQFLRRHARLAGPVIGADDGRGIAEATAHLIGLGHRRIGFIGGPEELSTGAGRVAGYGDALAAAGIAPDEALIRQGMPRPEFGAVALSGLLDLDRPPTAVVVASSRLVLGALEVVNLRRLSLPADLSLVGYGDPDWFRLWRPGVTAIALPVSDMATTAASLLFRRMARPDQPDRATADAPFRPTLILRGTTAPPGAARTGP